MTGRTRESAIFAHGDRAGTIIEWTASHRTWGEERRKCCTVFPPSEDLGVISLHPPLGFLWALPRLRDRVGLQRPDRALVISRRFAGAERRVIHVERAELARLLADEAGRQRELREAHRLFVEIGAPLRAAQVARELA